MPFLNQQKGENDRRKYFIINLHERMLPDPPGPHFCLFVLRFYGPVNPIPGPHSDFQLHAHLTKPLRLAY